MVGYRIDIWEVGVKMMFEKIRERLQKKIDYYNEQYESILNRGMLSGRAKSRFKASAYKEAIDIINQVEAEYNNGWISVDDRLPEPNKVCLVAYKVSGVISIAIFLFNGIDFNQTEEIEVIYWQPLPQPPKGE